MSSKQLCSLSDLSLLIDISCPAVSDLSSIVLMLPASSIALLQSLVVGLLLELCSSLRSLKNDHGYVLMQAVGMLGPAREVHWPCVHRKDMMFKAFAVTLLSTLMLSSLELPCFMLCPSQTCICKALCQSL